MKSYPSTKFKHQTPTIYKWVSSNLTIDGKSVKHQRKTINYKTKKNLKEEMKDQQKIIKLKGVNQRNRQTIKRASL